MNKIYIGYSVLYLCIDLKLVVSLFLLAAVTKRTLPRSPQPGLTGCQEGYVDIISLSCVNLCIYLSCC